MSTLYKCENCELYFEEEELEVETTSYENLYGVGGEFQDSHKCQYYKCPCCGGDDLEEVNDLDFIDIIKSQAERLVDLKKENRKLKKMQKN